MQWYKTGTVAVTNGSKTVNGTGTSFITIAGLSAGDAFTLDDSQFYEIEAVVSETELTLVKTYAGATQSGVAFAIDRRSSNSLSNDALAARVATRFTEWQQFVDQVNTWKAGTANGGPNSDGEYPLTDPLGNEYLLPCPAKVAADAATAVVTASSAVSTADMAKTFARAAGIVAHGEIDLASFDDTYTFGTTPYQFTIAARREHINGFIVDMPQTDITLPAAPSTAAELYRKDSVWLRVNASGSGEYIVVQGATTPAGYTPVSGENNLWTDGTYHAKPMCDVLRKRNSLAYHLVHNKLGCARSINADGTTPAMFHATDRTYASAADCETYRSGGEYGTTSGSPWGLHYDLIYQHDIKDRRVSAQRVTDGQQYAKDQLVALKEGRIRGLKKVTRTKWVPQTVTVGGAASWGATNGGFIYFDTSASDNPRDVTTAIFTNLNASKFLLSGNNGEAMMIARPKSGITTDEVRWPYSTNKGYLYGVDNVAAEFNSKFPVGTKLMIGAQYEAEVESANDIGRTALIGDPFNLYRGHYDYLSSDGVQTIETGEVVLVKEGYNEHPTDPGIAGRFYRRIGASGSYNLSAAAYGLTSVYEDLGTDREDSWLSDDAELPFEWLGVAEDGSSLIPDGTSKTFKLPHKCDLLHLWLTSLNSGKSYTDNPSSFTALFNSATNSITSATLDPAGRLHLLFYTSKANPLKGYQTPDSTIAELLQVVTSDSSRLVDYTTDKVAVGTGEETAIILHEKNDIFQHYPVDLDGTGPAAKFHAALVALNGKHHLELRAKEMVYDASLDIGNEFTDVTEANTIWVVGDYYHVTDGTFRGFWQCVKQPGTLAFSDVNWTEVDGKLIFQDQDICFVRWDGNGWGDDNSLDSTATTADTDDNGQVIKQGRYLVELDTFSN